MAVHRTEGTIMHIGARFACGSHLMLIKVGSFVQLIKQLHAIWFDFQGNLLGFRGCSKVMSYKNNPTVYDNDVVDDGR